MVKVKDVEESIRLLLHSIDYDTSLPENLDILATPERVAKMWLEFLTPDDFQLTDFEGNGYDSMVVQKEIPLFSFCRYYF